MAIDETILEEQHKDDEDEKLSYEKDMENKWKRKKRVFESVAKGTRVRVGVISGQQSVQEDMLVDVSNIPPCSRVHILVATPGRLSHNLHHTPLFSLTDLRYLVIDEADRLFEQHYHG